MLLFEDLRRTSEERTPMSTNTDACCACTGITMKPVRTTLNLVLVTLRSHVFHARPAGGACTLGCFVVYFCDMSSTFVEAAPVHFETLGRLLLAHVVYFWERGDRALWGVLSSTFGACRLLLENTKSMNVSHFCDGAACAACMSSTFGKGASVHFGGRCRLLLVNVIYFWERSSCAL